MDKPMKMKCLKIEVTLWALELIPGLHALLTDTIRKSVIDIVGPLISLSVESW
jgi:hypothetical protein